MRKYIAIAAAMFLVGCATNEQLKTSEILKDARSAAFVQNGRGAASYVIGAVDGKTSWSNYSIMGERLSGPNQNKGSAPYITPTGKVGPDAAANLGLEVVSHVGKAIADASMKDDPEYYDRLLTAMVGSRELASEAGPPVLKLLAGSFSLVFDPAKLRTLDVPEKLEDEQGRYLLSDPGTDVVVVFTLREVLLSEKPSMRGLKAVVTMGMYDKEVMPYLTADLAVFRRQPTGEFRRAWASRCQNPFTNDAPAMEWVDLRQNPNKGGPLFDQTLPRLVKGCAAVLSDSWRPADYRSSDPAHGRNTS